MSVAQQFGSYLQSLRRSSGDLSQDEVVRRAKKLTRGSNVLSKSTLSLYERGEIAHLRPDIAKLLAEIYGVAYAELVSRWVEAVYQTSATIEHGGMVRSARRDSCILSGPTEDDSLHAVSLERFTEIQGALTRGAEVGVCTLSFLDNDVLFDMVSANLAKGVKYYYVLPEDERISYKVFTSRVVERYPELRRKVDGHLTHFFPRHPIETHTNYAIFLHADGSMGAYVGFLYDRRVQCFQVADPALALRVYRSFSLSMAVAKDAGVLARLNDLSHHTAARSLQKKRLSFE